NCGKEVGRQQLHTINNDHKQECPHKQNRELKIKFIPISEQRNNLSGEKLKSTKTNHRYNCIPANCQQISLFHTVIFTSAIIEADNRLYALRNTNDNRQQDGIGLHNDTTRCQRNLLTINR